MPEERIAIAVHELKQCGLFTYDVFCMPSGSIAQDDSLSYHLQLLHGMRRVCKQFQSQSARAVTVQLYQSYHLVGASALWQLHAGFGSKFSRHLTALQLSNCNACWVAMLVGFWTCIKYRQLLI